MATTPTYFSPAKLNLFLAITGRRPDGFHDLVSVVAPLAMGDTLTVRPAAPGNFSLTCSDPEVPCDETNLVQKAAKAFVTATAWRGGAAFHLEKRIPMGAGLGGGSSNGVAALRGLNKLAGEPLDAETMRGIAATLGSDCPLFLYDAPVVMRGRGERIELLPPAAAARLRGRRVMVFKPAFGIPTAWAYRRLAEMALDPAVAPSGCGPQSESTAGGHDRFRPDRATKAEIVPQPASNAVYMPLVEAEDRLARWVAAPSSPAEALLFNTLERPAFEKYLALPALLERLGREFGIAPRMTGSGSACFALLGNQAQSGDIRAMIRAAWGDTAFLAETEIA